MPEPSVSAPAAPLVSVVIPSLNQRAYLSQAIESVLAQSPSRFELIVMDGGSTDGSVDVIERYASRLKYWRSAPDAGPAAALNQGFAHASGEILAVLNADDFFLPGAFMKVIDQFARSTADVVSGHGFFARPSGELGVPNYSDRWKLSRFRYGVCVLVQPSTFFRRDAFERAGGFRQSGRVCWDMELWADMAAHGARFEVIDEFLSVFRLHESSITGRDDLRALRRQHAREVMEEVRKRPESAADRVFHLAFRALKFAGHPLRTLRQRTFVHEVLTRWSI
jgi:glycosyltransferase involved in cell wall biosynthesis